MLDLDTGRRAGLLVVPCALLVAALLSSWSDPLSANGEGSVAFVDLERVVDEYKKTETLKTGLRQVMDARLEEIRKEEEDLRAQEEEIQFLNRESEEYVTKADGIATRRFLLRRRAERLEKEWNRKVVTAYRDIVSDIDREIDALGKERGYVAIHRIGGSELNGGEVDEKEVVFKLKLRQVLYHDPAMEITDEVLARLNR